LRLLGYVLSVDLQTSSIVQADDIGGYMHAITSYHTTWEQATVTVWHSVKKVVI